MFLTQNTPWNTWQRARQAENQRDKVSVFCTPTNAKGLLCLRAPRECFDSNCAGLTEDYLTRQTSLALFTYEDTLSNRPLHDCALMILLWRSRFKSCSRAPTVRVYLPNKTYLQRWFHRKKKTDYYSGPLFLHVLLSVFRGFSDFTSSRLVGHAHYNKEEQQKIDNILRRRKK